jgi:hypothetical protein
MNHTRHVETVSGTPQRKSLRQRKPLEVNNSFFKKVYKPKNPQACQTSSQEKTCPEPNDPHLAMLRDAAVHLFHPITPNSLQFKAILNYRIKKLKRLRSREACKQSEAPTANSESDKKAELMRVRATLRSIQARLRQRDFRGKFLSSEKNNSDLHEATTVDMREASTTRGSLLGQPMQIEALWRKSETHSRIDSMEDTTSVVHLTAAGGDPCAGDNHQHRINIEDFLSYIRVQQTDFELAEECLFAAADSDDLSEDPPELNPLDPQAFDHRDHSVSRKLEFSMEDLMEPFDLTDNYLTEQISACHFGDSTRAMSCSAFV